MKGHHEPPVRELDLGDLPDEIATVQRPVVESAARLRQARNRLLRTGPSVFPRRASRSWVPRALRWSPFALAVCAIVVFALVWGRGEPTLTFEVGSRDVAVRLGAPVQATDAPLPLRFSDGSTFTIGHRSRLTVADVSSRGAGLVLNEGALEAVVVHRAQSHWRVQAGPYTVSVTGTRFAVEWRPQSRSFRLTLHEGAVTVYGPSLGATGRRVVPRETVHLGPEPAPAAGTSPSPPLAPATAGATPTSLAARDRVPAAPPSGPPTWKRLAQAGRYVDALAVADAEGFAALCRRAPAADLLLLGNTARFAQLPDRAELAFRATRARKGAGHESAVAAFELGRLAHDVRRNYRDSAEWFAVYLREEVGGALAHEASGRRMEALHRAGDVRAAAGAAETYLRLYPGGAYQGLARQVLRE
jgi:transmembrane sensor